MKDLLSTILILLFISCSSSSEDKDKTAPGILTNLKVNSGNASVTLSWTLPSDNDINAINVYVKESSSAYAKSENVNAHNLDSATVTNLTNYTSYTFKVSAVDKSGNESEHSAEITGTPEDFTNSISSIWDNIITIDNSALTLIDQLLALESISSDPVKKSELIDAKGWYYHQSGNGLHTDDNYQKAYEQFKQSTTEDSEAGVAILGYLLKDFENSLLNAKKFKTKLSYKHSHQLQKIETKYVLLNGGWSAYRLSEFEELKSILDILDPSTTHTLKPSELFEALRNLSE